MAAAAGSGGLVIPGYRPPTTTTPRPEAPGHLPPRMVDALPTLSRKQLLAIREFTSSEAPLVTLLTGSARAGKTSAANLAYFFAVPAAPRSGMCSITGRTRGTIAANVFNDLTNPDVMGPLVSEVSYRSGAEFATILGRQVRIIGTSDATADAIIRGMTSALGYADELTVMNREAWRQYTLRHSVPGARIIATTNPDAPGHWVKTDLIDKRHKTGYRVRSFTQEDNPGLSEKYKARMRAEHVGVWYDRFILGRWVGSEGAIYRDFTTSRHVIPTTALPANLVPVAVGMDHGTSGGRTRGYLIAIGDHPTLGHRCLFVVDEFAPDQGLSDARQVGLYVDWARRHTIPALFLDPAADNMEQALMDANLLSRHADNRVSRGIQTVSALLATDRLLIADRCTELIKYLPGYAWDSKAAEKGEDKPVKVDDHEADALRYAVQSTRPWWEGAIPLTVATDGAAAAA